MDEVLADYAAAATPALIAGYDELSSARIYAPVRDFLPREPARIADIGAGTGRDAAWFAGQGHRVLAVEPVREFREAGSALHGDRIGWLDDQLPELARLQSHGPFDLVMLCAVWHHLDTPGRACAMPSLAQVTAPGGRLILSLRHDPAPGRGTFPAPPEETIDLAGAAGLDLVHRAEAGSVHPESRAKGVRWTWLVLTKDARD
ncbi:class I SAM-dependent methyltransferase [Sphingomonas psychrotolerans]|uniref:Class I SAM-dependent methyltransferase n=1 Tax=Sphingomonas psychrotolerans TaxID=1327635 RepID=A0A2K8MIZ7_9SPHN|nr:methyltransferase domain-containing protein [Sphingomonas psychrotolerans]ATY33845.1 class I SAM-dependent methyltransferase [Sphingomonas psychrotolerans]